MGVFAFLQLKLRFFWPLYLFKRTSQKPCLWYLCYHGTSWPFNSPLNCFYYLCWKARSSKEVKTGLFPNQKPQGFSVCTSVPVPVTRQCLRSKLFHNIDFFFIALYSLKSTVELNFRFVFYLNAFHVDCGTGLGYIIQSPCQLWFIRKPLLLTANNARAWDTKVWRIADFECVWTWQKHIVHSRLGGAEHSLLLQDKVQHCVCVCVYEWHRRIY